MLDYNEVDDPPTHQTQGQAQHERDQVRAAPIDNIEGVLQPLLPAGVIRRNCFYIGNVYGAAGDSLEVVLTGPKAGLWTDRAEGTGGDLFHLIAGNRSLDIKTEFAGCWRSRRTCSGFPWLSHARQSQRRPLRPWMSWAHRPPSGITWMPRAS